MSFDCKLLLMRFSVLIYNLLRTCVAGSFTIKSQGRRHPDSEQEDLSVDHTHTCPQ